MRRVWAAASAALLFLAGCAMVEVGVTNPVAGLTTVAVAPFFNLSAERAVDGRRFALAYYSELQKVPGFQVVPVGVVEQVIFDEQLEMNNPDDVLRLADLLGVDAVVVGAVTDYSPYYPPRIGLQVSWYSPDEWEFVPGIPTDEFALSAFKPRVLKTQYRHAKVVEKKRLRREMYEMQYNPDLLQQGDCPPGSPCAPGSTAPIEPFVPPPAPPSTVRGQSPQLPPDRIPESAPVVIVSTDPFDPRQPLMSYTRMFDGSDAKLTANLRDYVELSGDLRSGGWEGYLYRSEDFIRYTAHAMIVEMLQLHGGEAKRRVVFKLRKYK